MPLSKNVNTPSSVALFFPSANPKIELTALEIDADYLDLHFVSQTIAAAGAAADQRVGSLVVIIIIVGQRADVHQAFDGQIFRLAEKAIVGHAGDDRFHLQSDALAQIGEQFDFD